MHSDARSALQNGQPHREWTAADFPTAHTATVCLGCSYSADGLPLHPVPYPCDKVPARRLADAVRRRRVRLGLSQLRLAERGPVSATTIHQVESGQPKNLRGRTADRLERALCWDPGSIRRVLDGGEPGNLPHDASTLPEVQVVLTAGLPDVVEELLAAHMASRRADMEAALEAEAHLLVEQARAVQRDTPRRARHNRLANGGGWLLPPREP